MSFDRYCCGSWKAKGGCTAWNEPGDPFPDRPHPFHGCDLMPGHRDTCICKCGAREYGRSEFSVRDARKRNARHH